MAVIILVLTAFNFIAICNKYKIIHMFVLVAQHGKLIVKYSYIWLK